MSADNLKRMFDLADKTDYREGLLAYQRYHDVMQDVAKLYSLDLERVCAAFCALSPNNDYKGNLRSLISVVQGVLTNTPRDRITVSTYKHCRDRAHDYLTGEAEFDVPSRGLKVLSFYRNIVNPHDNRYVTIDGHMVGAWRADNSMIMKDAKLTRSGYREIEHAVKALAFNEFILPNQYQAIVWFVRKRICRVKFDPQGDVFDYADADVWRTYQDVRKIEPFPLMQMEMA